MNIPYARPSLLQWDTVKDSIQRIYESGMLTNGKWVAELEKRAANYLGVEHAIACSNCTAGLMLLLGTLDPHAVPWISPADIHRNVAEWVGPKSEVIIPGFTFSATYQAIEWNGLKPVFVDVDDDCNISVEAVRAAITPRTAAILAVHISGNPCDGIGLEKVAREAGIPLFFDAAHAFGAKVGTQSVAMFGKASVFSFGATKVIGVGEGGLITTNDDELAERLRKAVNHGHVPDSLDYAADAKGFNARMQEIPAYLACMGIERIDELCERRAEIRQAYMDELDGKHGIKFVPVRSNSQPSWKDVAIFVNPEVGFDFRSRDNMQHSLGILGIQTKAYYHPACHKLNRVASGARLPNAERLAKSVLALPCYTDMGVDEIEAVCNAIHALAV